MIFGKEMEQTDGVTIHNILIVEDDPIVAFDNEHTLINGGYAVVGTVNSYANGVDALDEGGVDLMIADIGLSGPRDGVELARYAKQLGVAVLFVSGSCPLQAPELAVGCLSKPFMPRDLLLSIKAVEAVLSGRRTGRVPRDLNLFSK